MKQMVDGDFSRALSEMSKAEPDLAVAFASLELSYGSGNPQAAYALGTWYLHGRYVDKDAQTAVKLLFEAAKGGVRDSYFDLAVCFETGVGVERDCRRAAENYLRAAIRGDKQAIFEVGRCYFAGIGFRKNRRLAEIWFDRSREVGSFEQSDD